MGDLATRLVSARSLLDLLYFWMACFICNKITLDSILWFHNVIAQILGDYCGFGTVRNQLSNLRNIRDHTNSRCLQLTIMDL